MIEFFKVEFEVLDVVWFGYFVMVSEVIVCLSDDKEWYEKIIKMLLSCLVKKGVLSFEK